MPISLAARDVLDREFLSIRSKLIDIAAVLDRIDRGAGDVSDDPRRCAIRQGLQKLASDSPDRAEGLQLLFSLPYQDDWRKEYGV